jgi:hypothetical protein
MYPGNHTDSEILSVPRNLKTRPDADETHLAYITDDEADLLEIYKPGTPHRGAEGIPNYDGGDLLDYVPSGMGGTGYGSQGSGASQETVQEAQQHQEQVQQNYIDMYGANEQGQPDMYQPPEEVYGPGQTGVIPGETQYNWKNITQMDQGLSSGVWNTVQNMFKTGSGMNTLEFYGIVKKDPNTGKYFWTQASNGGKYLPAEFINQIAEGSIVSGNEAIESTEPWIGTWDDVGSGEHAMFPGGLQDYYSATKDPFIVPYTGGSSGGPGPHYGGWGYGYGGGRGGGRGGGYGGGGGTPKYGGDFAGENPWGLSHIQRKWIEQLRNPHGGGYFRGMNRGGIVSLC